MTLIKKIKDLIFLYFYYKEKKKGFVCDLHFDSWHTLTKNDVGVYKMELKLSNGSIARFVLFRLDNPGFIPSEVYYDLEFVDELPYIRNCSFIEFYKLYKDTILFMVDNEKEVLIHGY